MKNEKIQTMVVVENGCLGDKIFVQYDEFADGTKYYALYYVDNRVPSFVQECKAVGTNDVIEWLEYWIDSYENHETNNQKVKDVYNSFVTCYQQLLHDFKRHLETNKMVA